MRWHGKCSVQILSVIYATMNQSTISEEPRNKAFDNKENPPIMLWISVAKYFFLAKRHLLKCATAGFLCTWEFNRNKGTMSGNIAQWQKP
jgi:hypothetical protein